VGDFVLKRQKQEKKQRSLGSESRQVISLPIIITSLRLNVLYFSFTVKDYSTAKRHSLRSSMTVKLKYKPMAMRGDDDGQENKGIF